jgi:aromatic ring-opening dioxygenase catalytic subunit (LigB family)
MSSRQPTWFLSHGGGPWPWMGGAFRQHFTQLEAALQAMPGQLPEAPRAVLMVSGHWETPGFEVMAHAQPGMVHDYSGFPAHTYEIRYPAPGSPELARRVVELLDGAQLPCSLNAHQGFDHGAFVPMAVMYPQAQVPMVQLSLQRGENADVHLALGRALAPLRDEGVMIIGSGLSFHNLRLFGPEGQRPSQQFDAWLQSTMALKGTARSEALSRWTEAPAARQAHPRAEHLIPLMVAAGAAEQESAHCSYHETNFFGRLTVSSFRLG